MFRERLIAKMDAANIPEDARLAHLSALTGRVPQSSRRWIDPVNPGLPDLVSFALLCKGFGSDANWFLGLPTADHAYSEECGFMQCGEGALADKSNIAAWVKPLLQEFSEAVKGCAAMKMAGDDMEPVIHDGDTLFVDLEARNIVGNGIYVVECDGRVMVRNVESRIGEGLVLSCENPKYQASVIKNAAAARKLGLKVLGKARSCISILKFSRND
ncbi:MAG: S24 family peptidase [Pseudomonadota bacterium]